MNIFRMIEDCIVACGSDSFAMRFLELAESMGIHQLMIFEISRHEAFCLLSRNYSRMKTGEQLAGRYLDGWFLKDPLLPELLELREGETRLRHMEDIVSGMSPEYREIFFDRPGLAGKTTVLVAGANRRLIVNFYHAAGDGKTPDDALLSLAARLALMHFDAPPPIDYPVCLGALSERERQVCLGVLDGKKAEAIAGELGLSAATVVTYRRRAYEKLGISSRGGLFAICRRN